MSVVTSESLFLTSREVAAWLRVSPSTLCRWRYLGTGPKATWMSQRIPRYRREDVEAWLKKVAG